MRAADRDSASDPGGGGVHALRRMDLCRLRVAGGAARDAGMRKRWQTQAGGAFVLFTVMLAVAPLLWMGYNGSSSAIRWTLCAGRIRRRRLRRGRPRRGRRIIPAGTHAGRGAVFSKGGGAWRGRRRAARTCSFCWRSAGTVAAAIEWRDKGVLPALLLWMPLPFYVYSVAYGSVPIFIPLWWPHS